jgi:hypothetical protein
VRLRRDAHSEVDPRPAGLALRARVDASEHVAFFDPGTAPDGERPKVHECHRVAVLGPQRERATTSGHHAGEGDESAHRSENVLTPRSADVDAAVLPRAVGVAVDVEGLEHRARDRPRPCEAGRREREGHYEHNEHRECGNDASVANLENHSATVSGPSVVVKVDYREPR